MNNEETIFDQSTLNNSAKTDANSAANPMYEIDEKKSNSKKWAYASGGAVVGAGATLAGQTVAAPKTEMPENQPSEEKETATDGTEEKTAVAAVETATEEQKAVAATEKETGSGASIVKEDGVTIETNGTTIHVSGDASVDVIDGNIHVTTSQPDAETLKDKVADASDKLSSHQEANKPAPEPEDSIIVTDDGIRVAHVDDDLSFSQAFAEARSQVGAGGVFEWHGKVYSTYYKDEWDAMTPQERNAYQASIDYEDVMHDSSHDMAHNNDSHATTQHHTHATEASYTAGGSEDVEVSIIGAGVADIDGDGAKEYSVALDYDGQKILLVDIDRDGTADVAIADINNDGHIGLNEIVDASAYEIHMPTPEDVDMMASQSNDVSGYMNDADAGMYMI